MGRQSALEDNGFKKGSKEYVFWHDKMTKLEDKVYDISYRTLTPAKCLRIIRMLYEFEKAGFEFTIGYFDYKVFKEFLEKGLDVLDLNFMSLIIKEYLSMKEINPIRYGYKKDGINSAISSLECLKNIKLKE